MARTRVVDHSCEEAERPHISGTSTAATEHTQKPKYVPLAATFNLFVFTETPITPDEMEAGILFYFNKETHASR